MFTRDMIVLLLLISFSPLVLEFINNTLNKHCSITINWRFIMAALKLLDKIHQTVLLKDGTLKKGNVTYVYSRTSSITGRFNTKTKTIKVCLFKGDIWKEQT